MSTSGAIRAGKAYVEISTDESGLNAGLKRVQAKLGAWGKSLQSVGGKAFGGGLPPFLQPIADFAASPAGLLTGMTTAGMMFAEYGDDMATLGERAGTSAQTMMGLAYAAKMTDTNIESVAVGIKKMQQSVAQASIGGAKLAEVMQLTGINLAALKNLSPEDQLASIAEKIAAIDNPSKKTAAAMAIFGKSGTDLIPLLNQGAAGLAQFRKEAEEMGLILSKEDVQAAGELDDAWKRLYASGRSVVYAVGAALAPVMKSAADLIRGLLTPIREWIDKNRGLVIGLASIVGTVVAVGSSLAGIGATLGFMAFGFSTLAGIVAAVSPALPFLAAGAAIAGGVYLLGRFTNAFERLGPMFSNMSRQWSGFLADTNDSIGAIFKAIAGGRLQDAWNVVTAYFRVEWMRLVEVLNEAWNTFTEDLRGYLDQYLPWWRTVATGMQSMWNGFVDVFKSSGTVMTEAWKGICGTLRTTFASVVEFATNKWEDFLDWATNVEVNADPEALDKLKRLQEAAKARGLTGPAVYEDLPTAREARKQDQEAAKKMSDAEESRRRALVAFEGLASAERLVNAKDQLDAAISAAKGIREINVGGWAKAKANAEFAKSTSAGTFSSQRLEAWGAGGTVQERIAKAGEKSNEKLTDIAELLKRKIILDFK